MIYEAICQKCGKIANPIDEHDLVHIENDCEGQLIIQGVYIYDETPIRRGYKLFSRDSHRVSINLPNE